MDLFDPSPLISFDLLYKCYSILLFLIANELKEEENMLKPEDIVTLLQISKLGPTSRDHYPQHERMRK
jgi:hypothetical protein